MTRPGAGPADERRLAEGELSVVGRLGDASNAVFLVRVERPESRATGDVAAGSAGHAIYKPVRGERPLWDFPDGQLAHREVAAYLISSAGGWDLVPATVLRDGPYGVGSVQHWVTPPPYDADAHESADADESDALLDELVEPDEVTAGPDILIVPLGAVPDGYLPVLSGRLPDGTAVQVAHADTDELAAMAVLDAVLNNSDRKGSHVLRDPAAGLWGVDHGVSLHVEDKLRTVLWGWEGDPIRPADLDRLETLARTLADVTGPLRQALEPLLTRAEITALANRVEVLRRRGRYPAPPDGWPSVPWPPL